MQTQEALISYGMERMDGPGIGTGTGTGTTYMGKGQRASMYS